MKRYPSREITLSNKKAKFSHINHITLNVLPNDVISYIKSFLYPPWIYCLEVAMNFKLGISKKYYINNSYKYNNK